MFEIFTGYFGAEIAKLSENDSITNTLCFAGYLISAPTAQPYCNLEEHRNREANEYDGVAIKLYFLKIWVHGVAKSQTRLSDWTELRSKRSKEEPLSLCLNTRLRYNFFFLTGKEKNPSNIGYEIHCNIKKWSQQAIACQPLF